MASREGAVYIRRPHRLAMAKRHHHASRTEPTLNQNAAPDCIRIVIVHGDGKSQSCTAEWDNSPDGVIVHNGIFQALRQDHMIIMAFPIADVAVCPDGCDGVVVGLVKRVESGFNGISSPIPDVCVFGDSRCQKALSWEKLRFLRHG